MKRNAGIVRKQALDGYRLHRFVGRVDFFLLGEVYKPESSMLRAISDLREYGLNPWLSHGAALGMQRDGGLIPWDTDIDLGVLVEWGDTPRVPLTKTLDCKFSCLGLYKDKMVMLKFVYGETLIDLGYHYLGLRDPETVTFVSSCGFTHYPRELIDGKVEQVETKFGKVPMLSKVEEYLEYQYGADWREPKRESRGIHPMWYEEVKA